MSCCNTTSHTVPRVYLQNGGEKRILALEPAIRFVVFPPSAPRHLLLLYDQPTERRSSPEARSPRRKSPHSLVRRPRSITVPTHHLPLPPRRPHLELE